MTAVLQIGVDPKTVDPADPAVPPGTTPESIARGIAASLEDMKARGWFAAHCAIMPDASAESAITRCLEQREWDVVVIGAGVRVPPQFLELFERVVNAVRRGAPNAAIAFNTTPVDSGDAAARCLDGNNPR